MRMNLSNSLLLLLAVSPFMAYAQTVPETSVQEDELALCLRTELQAREQFTALENRANALRAEEDQLKERRAALGREKTFMDSRKPDPVRVTKYNEDIRAFNAQTDQLNASKDLFERDSQAYDNWANTHLKPACSKLNGRTVKPVTSFYGCGYHLPSSKLQQLPHCSSLPNLPALKACVSKAGSKAKAQETCNTEE